MLPHTAVHRDFLRVLAPCGGDAACTTDALDRATGPLAARIESLPSGREGLAAWIRLAASLEGALISVPPVPTTSLPEAIRSFWAETGYAPTAADLAALRTQTARLDASSAASIAEMVNALRVSNALAERATRGSGIELLKADPIRAMRLVGLASAKPGTVPEALRLEATRITAVLDRIDMDAMATAAAVLADALAGFTHAASAPPEEDIDVPFIFVGGEGDTAHSEDRALLIDMSGNDIYTNNAGGGVFGIGPSLAADLGAGNDVYDKATGAMAQGSGFGGVGILYDEGGADSYNVYQFGQASAVGGVGILYDAGTSNDVYMSDGVQPIATKASALGGIAALIDAGGDDSMRQDGLDGFDYGAAGLALLANLGQGDDTYVSNAKLIPGVCVLGEDPCPPLGTFAGPIQVSAEVNGTAILYEEGGNDRYTCGTKVRQGCQGASGAGSFALLWDRGGNDVYWMGDSESVTAPEFVCLVTEACEGDPAPIALPLFPMGQGAAYGVCVPCSPPSIGILLDEDGSDSYTAARWAQGYGTFGGLGILADNGADSDTYSMQAPLYGERGNAKIWVDGILGIGRDD